MRIKAVQLSPKQWRLLTSVFSNIGQAVLLFAAAAFFVPEAVGLIHNYSKINAFLFVLAALSLIVIAVIISNKEEI